MIGSEIAKKSVTRHVVIDALDRNFEIFQLVAIEIFQVTLKYFTRRSIEIKILQSSAAITARKTMETLI